MERIKKTQRIINGEFRKLQGETIEIWPEMKHITIYSKIKTANLTDEKCSICKRNIPIIVRYEQDHWAREYYDIYCESCTPERILASLRGKGE